MDVEIIKISGNPERLKTNILENGSALVEIDSLDNDYTHTCHLGDYIVVEPSRPPISATRRYMVWYQNKLIYCKIKRTRDLSKWNILGIGEINVCDIHFWCNARNVSRLLALR